MRKSFSACLLKMLRMRSTRSDSMSRKVLSMVSINCLRSSVNDKSLALYSPKRTHVSCRTTWSSSRMKLRSSSRLWSLRASCLSTSLPLFFDLRLQTQVDERYLLDHVLPAPLCWSPPSLALHLAMKMKVNKSAIFVRWDVFPTNLFYGSYQ